MISTRFRRFRRRPLHGRSTVLRRTKTICVITTKHDGLSADCYWSDPAECARSCRFEACRIMLTRQNNGHESRKRFVRIIDERRPTGEIGEKKTNEMERNHRHFWTFEIRVRDEQKTSLNTIMAVIVKVLELVFSIALSVRGPVTDQSWVPIINNYYFLFAMNARRP